MELNRPLSTIIPTLDADVLGVLAGADGSFTGRQVHKIMGRYSEKSARNSLQRLCFQGVVLKQDKGSLGLYSLNQDHLAFPYIVGLSRLKSELFVRASSLIATWSTEPVLAAIFGSSVGSQMRVDSDIDIFLVRPRMIPVDDQIWVSLHSNLADSVTRWTGNDTRIFELSETEVIKGLAKKERVLLNIRERSVILHGDKTFLESGISVNRKSNEP